MHGLIDIFKQEGQFYHKEREFIVGTCFLSGREKTLSEREQ